MAQVAFLETPDFHVEKESCNIHMPMMHYHHTFELYYLYRGEREYFIGDEFYKVTEGDVVFIPQRLLHRTAGRDVQRFLVYFSEAFLARFFTPELMEGLPLDKPFVFRPDEEMGALINEELELMLRSFREGSAPQNEALLVTSLARLLLSLKEARNHYVPEFYTDRRIGQIVRYINEHYFEIEDIEQVAERFYISKYHLCRIFNKNLGLPLVAYLNTIKIRAATELIQNEKLSLTDIATRCGFNSSSYFCKVFKNEKGVSPAAYRKQLKSK